MISAEEAGKRSAMAMHCDSNVLEPYLDHIGAKIAEATDEGLRHINHPFAPISAKPATCHHPGATRTVPSPSFELKRAIKVVLTKLGYAWEDHPDPDPGHPAGGAYVSVSW